MSLAQISESYVKSGYVALMNATTSALIKLMFKSINVLTGNLPDTIV